MSVTTKKDLLDLLQKHRAELRAFGVKRCGLFGSFARNQPTPQSDVDLLVEFEPGQKTFANFSNLAFFLEELFDRRVDLVTTESLSPYIGPHILREAEYVSIGA
ncbi:MAG: nucleotidyltransferase family protein [Blastocatellales bacterium]